MDIVTGAVAIMGLKHVGQPAVGVVADFLKRVLSPTGDALGEAIAHPIVEWQKRRIARAGVAIENAARIALESGKEVQAVPSRILLPLLERASLEENEELFTRWTALLANVSTAPDMVLPAFVTILGELSPTEARLLERVYEVLARRRILQPKTQNFAGLVYVQNEQAALTRELRDGELMKYIGVNEIDMFDVLSTNLERLSLVQRRPDFGESEKLEGADWGIQLTTFGQAFMRACTEPSRRREHHSSN